MFSALVDTTGGHVMLLARGYLNEMNRVQVESIINYTFGLHHIHFRSFM